jgi:hypothetical protein
MQEEHLEMFQHILFIDVGLLNVILSQGQHPRLGGGGGAAGLQPPKTSENRYLKNTDFVDIMISKLSRDLPFSRKQPLKSADDSTLEF